MPVVYEWDAETVSTDGYEDVLDHSHRDTAIEALRDIDQIDKPNMRLVLVRDVWDKHEGLIDRTWAYVDDDKLPEKFADADGLEQSCVPKRYHSELRHAKDFLRLERKVAHGCTDASCGLCDA